MFSNWNLANLRWISASSSLKERLAIEHHLKPIPHPKLYPRATHFFADHLSPLVSPCYSVHFHCSLPLLEGASLLILCNRFSIAYLSASTVYSTSSSCLHIQPSLSHCKRHSAAFYTVYPPFQPAIRPCFDIRFNITSTLTLFRRIPTHRFSVFIVEILAGPISIITLA